MFDPPVARMLPDGRRLHLQQGPIDLVIGAFGTDTAVAAAYAGAVRRFDGLLQELCDELLMLRAPAGPSHLPPNGVVARRMLAAVMPFAADIFITPMAAVAGAVAEEILGAMLDGARLDRAFVNNGGDIALHLAPGERFRIGLVDRPDRPGLFGTTEISEADPIRGIATSGRRGRSFSLGIADAVTVLAASAAMADAAATVIANAVDLPDHPAIIREPGTDIQPDSDLGARLVTRDVGRLADSDVEEALRRGVAMAGQLQARGLIVSAALHLQGSTRVAEGQGALLQRSSA
ncbi:UPF0280 family protein [Kaistia dalseonensis]|uniref:ApbE superfamily uncharacterized protein (UPF0280 family) n=1 Tax=Kaistia dalseonensis TaxID=410840 RepID=A0ABU0H2Q4_9HYPH|nr:UPF0280 family protein [Kaistia dalseonensis]MCX5494004.1 UPF0280 family protein [Kaistia dalseonensis]MDQ0436581.1 ApbE superfamily uncharacterized protein (UPF0280 family) [Kaistia dalseonensis]